MTTLYFVEQGLRFTEALHNAEQVSGNKYFPIKILMSYYQLQNKNLGDYLSRWVARDEIFLFIDSGAFSAFTQYKTIDVNEYGAWIDKNKDWIDCFANLDVKESWQKTASNMQALESAGLHPLPVYHLGEPPELLDDMLLNYDYICMGGMAGSINSIEVLRNVVRFNAMKAITAQKKMHLFGVGSFPVLLHVPAFSADSSSYIGYRWGKIKIFDDVKMKYVSYHVGSPELIRYEHVFSRMGLPSFPAMLKRAGKHAATLIRAFEYLNMKRAEEYLTAIWKARGITV